MESENEILIQLARIETKLNTALGSIGDHEKRIRFLERYAFILIGVFGLITVAIEIFKK